MSERKLQPWMRREQAVIWTAVDAVSLMAVGGLPSSFMSPQHERTHGRRNLAACQS
jgi:hypothetical protein